MSPPPDDSTGSSHQKRRLDSLFGGFIGIAEFFGKAAEATKDSSVIQAIVSALPWAEAVGGAFSEALPPVKFAVELIKNLTEESDPKVLGLYACTLAYQGAVEDAMAKVGGVPAQGKKAAAGMKEEIIAMESAEDVDFGKFSFAHALEHAFIKGADAVFEKYLTGVGYNEDQQRLLLAHTHRRFVAILKALLANPSLKEKFEPFARLVDLGTDEERAYDAILSHVEFQRWQFEEARVFGKEPFALKHVYIETECGVLTWREVKKGMEKSGHSGTKRFDPFLESCGGRQPLLKTVTDLLKDKDFHDAIVIQGAAGSGKSSFTLKLCTVLEQEGLYPIRIRLRDLPLDRHVSEAIPRALFPKDHELPESLRDHELSNPFSTGVFNDTVTYGSARIRSYVLILDGWDEISLAAQDGFKQRITKMLYEVRSQYLGGGPMVRVILTGRPSAEVGESNFLMDETRLLTIRPIRPEHLGDFVDRMRNALLDQPFGLAQNSDPWTIPSDDELGSVYAEYRKSFEQQRENSPAPGLEESGALAVLGLPLLAHLSIRLISRWDGDRQELISDPTQLYRNLVDLTCGHRGQAAETGAELQGNHPVGLELRRLLHRVAAAMTAHGEESIGYEELSLRMEDDNLDEQTERLTEANPLSTLMIAFFFKGGLSHLGCEFLHKSFREYLFAEGIIEEMKEFVAENEPLPPDSPRHWRDYEPGDPQHRFSRLMAEMLSPHWLKPEVISHLQKLLVWEIARSTDEETEPEASRDRCECHPASLERWRQIRDRLADLWRWWASGIHLRPQARPQRKSKQITLDPPYADELVELDMPRDPGSSSNQPDPARTTTMDSHLGEALFRLCATVHYQVAVREGWLEPRDGVTPPTPEDLWRGVKLPPPSNSWEGDTVPGARPYQARIENGDRKWVFFAPSGVDTRYFNNFVARIDAAGWRPDGPFPQGCCMDGIYLLGCRIANGGLYLDRGASTRTTWVHANLTGCDATLGTFLAQDFSASFALRCDFTFSFLDSANFDGAFLMGVDFSRSMVSCASFCRAILRGACFDRTYLNGADFADSELIGLIDRETDWEDALNVPARLLRQPAPGTGENE